MQKQVRPRRNHLSKSAPAHLRRGLAGFIGRLAACAFAAGTVLGSPSVARADTIVYSGPLDETIAAGIPTPDSGYTSSLVLDVGPAAATFVATSSDVRSSTCILFIFVCLEHEYIDNLSANIRLSLSGAYAGVDGAGELLPLSAGTGIGAGDTFHPSGASPFFVDQATSTYESTNLFGFIPLSQETENTIGGPWPDSSTPYFLGLEIPTGVGAYDYGWLEMRGGGATVTVLGYAYDETPGADIMAGEISNHTLLAVPEPTSLGLTLAALGALGFVVSRKRARFRTN
jgi:hypothetical protein